MPLLHGIKRSFRLRMAAGLALIAASSAAVVFVAVTGVPDSWIVPLVIILLWSTLSVIRRSERFLRDVQYFFESLRQHDYSTRGIDARRGKLQEAMAVAMERVMEDFRAERSLQEERIWFLETVVEHVGTAVIAYTLEGQVTLLNAAARRLLGVHRTRHLDALRERSPELFDALRAIEPGGQVLVRAPDQHAATRHLLVHSSRIIVGGTPQIVAAMYDIGSELEEREMQAWQQLTRVLTHEIMNSVAPISSLAGTAEKMLTTGSDGTPSDDVREAIRVIKRRSEALVSFVDAYRSFTRIPSPEYRLTPIREIFGRVVRLMRTQAERQQISLVVDADPASLQLAADPDLIEQILINLVLNALQALDDGGGTITLRARPDRRGIPYIEVEDDGPGIAPDVQEGIFVPFFTTKPEGSGIGLSLSRQIMRVHGGTLSVRSTPGETVFTLQF